MALAEMDLDAPDYEATHATCYQFVGGEGEVVLIFRQRERGADQSVYITVPWRQAVRLAKWILWTNDHRVKEAKP